MDANTLNSKVKGVIAAVLFTFAFVCVFVLVQVIFPAQAHAANYKVTADNIEANLDSTGDLFITETRTYQFDVSHTLVGRILAPSDKGDVSISSVSIESSGITQTLAEVPFQTSWRDSGGPGQACYSIDKEKNAIYTFGNYSDTASVTWTYIYTNVLKKYNDVADFYWQFIGKNEEVAVSNVNLTLKLPNIAGQTIKAGDNVHAWGHGALNGNISVSDVITYTCPKVYPGDYSEARVVFPSDWASMVVSSCTENADKLDSIMEEETKLVNEANAQRNNARILQNVLFWSFIILPIILCIVAFCFFWRFGREHKTKFKGKYWRDVPDKAVDPCVVGRIFRWNKKDPADLTAQLMDLSVRGVISLKPTTETKKKLLGGEKKKDTLELVWNKPDDYEGLSPIDKKTLNLIFKELAKDDAITADGLKEKIKSDRETAAHYLKNWQETVSDYVENKGYIEQKSKFLFGTFAILGLVVIIAPLMLYAFDIAKDSYIAQMPIAALSAIVFGIITIIISFQIRRRSVQGAEIAAKSKALKRWFKDFTNLEEAIPTDTKVWGRLLVYASLFGVAKEVVKALKVQAPDLFEDDWFMWYLCWSTPYGHAGFSMSESFSDAFGSALAATNDSSATGAGGGFSGGGGGGFGGGGGGFAR